MPQDLIKVLLIEDNSADARLVERYLTGTPSATRFELDWVDRVRRGQERLGSQTYDLVLLDLSLPDGDGLETFQAVKSAAADTPVVVMTGQDDERQAIRAMRGGAQDFLHKDKVDPDLLRRAIRYAIERKRFEEALRESQERYSLAVTGANDGIWDWNLRTGQVFYSDRWKEMLGLEAEDLAVSSEAWLDRVHPADVEGVKKALAEHLNSQAEHFQSEHRVQHGDGSYRWVLARGLAVRDAKGTPTRVAGSLTDIHHRRMTEEQLLHDAMHDALTQLPNSALFLDRLAMAIAQAKRRSGFLFAVLFFDLDRFKIINDSLGHGVGDRLLIAIAQRLLTFLRPGDTVARLGGDEFAILANDIEDPSDAHRIAERIQEELGRHFDLQGYEVFTTASIGIALSSTGYDRPQDVLRDADTAMYRAKSQGKAQYCVFDEAMHHHAVELLRLETDLRRAVERSEFCIYYQPIVSLATGKMVGLEALVRWRHPTRGLIEPDSFIPVAEETGLILPIGWAVLSEACGQMATWQRQEPATRHLTLSVNLSSKQFAQPDLLERVEEVLERTGLDPGRLRLEITESLIMDEAEGAVTKLEELRSLGVRLHLDDFGTGYSSLSYLHRLPTQTLKIDRSFVRRMGEGESGNQLEIVQTIVSLARSLGMRVAAEGLENSYQLDRLRELDCELGQGFYFSEPLDSESVRSLIRRDPSW